MKLKRLISIALAAVFCISTCLFVCSCNEKKDEEASANPFYFTYNGIKIELDKKADGVLEALGEAKSEDNLGDCGGIGVQIKYTYADFSINTLKEENGEMIHKIEFKNDLPKTSKGICIGSAESDVRSAYGTPSSEENGRLIYKKSDLELEFTVEGGEVTAINYRRIR